MVNLNFLESFIVLAETLSFSKTAKILNTSQPVISRQIKDLEASLGLVLFIRNKKSVVLSKDGRDLAQRIGPLYAGLKEQMGLNSAADLGMKQEIRFGSIYEAGEFLMIPRIKKYKQINPQTEIHMILQPSHQIIDQLENGSLDFGFVSRRPDKKTIKSFPIVTERAVLIGSKKQKKSWQDGSLIEMIGYRDGDQYLKSYIDKAFPKTLKKRVNITMSINSHRSIIELIKNTNYLAVIPENSFLQYKNSDDVEILQTFKSQHTLYLICHEKTLICKHKKAFYDFLISYIM